jgi:hypothetical protein
MSFVDKRFNGVAIFFSKIKNGKFDLKTQ